MSVFKLKGTPFYHFDFQIKRERFHGSTRCTNRREAEAFERNERELAIKSLKTKPSKASLQLDDVCARYWEEVGKYHANSDTTWTDLERLVDYFSPTKLLNEIGNSDVAELVSWRRGQRVVRGKEKDLKDCPFVSNATVNRSTTEVLKKLFTRAKDSWDIVFQAEPKWNLHFLPESKERVRELVGKEHEKLQDATRDDYAPFFEFAHAAGLRLNECLLRWSQVDWDAKRIRKPGKGKKLVSAPVTSNVMAILEPLLGHHKEFVFTYIAKRTKDGKIKGQRYPITYSGVKTQWRRMREKSGVVDFRFHDLRHDLATKLLRKTGNLKLVQKALNHADIKTTLRYAHVLDGEVADALETVRKSQTKPQSTVADTQQVSEKDGQK